MKDALSHLQSLGFGEYEARAYVALLQHGALTGYELARASGVPRPNIYAVLDRLQQRGAVTRLETAEGVRYSALAAEEMLRRLGRETEERIGRAEASIKALAAPPPEERTWNLSGYEHVISRAEELIDSARERLLLGVWSSEAARLAAAVERAEGRGVLVTTLCIQGCPEECGGCRGSVHRFPLAEDMPGRWLVISADDVASLVAQVYADGRAAGALTRIEAIAGVAGHYLRNAIAAAEIARSLGPRLGELLDDRALAALRGTGLAVSGRSWLERMLSAAAAGKEGPP